MSNAAAKTGTCPCCFGSYVVKNGTMVLHGYKRPGHGYIVGNCPATRHFQPYEVSVEGTVFMRKMAFNHLNTKKDHLKALEAGKVTELSVTRERESVRKIPYGQRSHLSSAERYEAIVLRKGDGVKREFYDTREWFEIALANEIANTKAEIRQVAGDVAFLDGKIASWKPVDLEKEAAEKAQAEAVANAKLCPGSGTTDHDHSRMRFAYYKGGKCNHCGRRVTASSLGKMRKHPPKEG